MNEKNRHIRYEMFALILSYPSERLLEKIETVQELLNQYYPDAAETMIEFTHFVKIVGFRKWEEIYTRTFDVQAFTTLDMGYVLFGDDYKRGELLVNLSKEHTKAGNDCGTELADNLPNLLKLLDKVEDKDFKNDLIYLIIKPALKKIISEFDDLNIDKKNKHYEKHHKTLIQIENNYGTAYKSLLTALLKVLNQDFTGDDKSPLVENQHTSNFTDKINLSD